VAHVAVTWDAATGEVTFFKNGAVAHLTVDAAPTAAPLEADPLTVGAWLSGGSFFRGAIDDLRIYDRVLAASEISALVNPAAHGP
jgi:hypothetical protein